MSATPRSPRQNPQTSRPGALSDTPARHAGRALLAALVLLLGACGGTGGGDSGSAQDLVRSVSVDGRSHSYRLHIPAELSAVPAPMLVSLHGGASNAVLNDVVTQLSTKADSASFVLLAANGYTDNANSVLYTWNAGACCDPAAADHIDQVKVLRAMLDDAATVVAINPKRVFAAGYSNGGMMAYRLACELSDRIAAIGVVAGEMMDKDLTLGLERTVFECNPPRAVPIFHMHGLSDNCALFEGGVGNGAQPRPPRSAVPDNIAFWSEHNGCTTGPTQTYTQGDARCETHSGCNSGADVVLCTVDSGGHIWPGSPASSYPSELQDACGGTTTQNLRANDQLWEFFKAHPMP